ncbi:malto-oligosyltrehalose trehalohydrolase [Deinococcus ruber]|uniref:Malto-oligosyltrehalose trehalohydrolase n=1 Tax=Deinococcus ruber TaxID=1848197 RepID=A0A918C0T3_9DEIO|nr:malto-oligosyltrehalose trehalohydrolase [Deinococcus ruber]GGQ99200.1 malto-oligosyltrehalose trehalohydrolase [Deinococcus ruber]
MKNPAPLSPRLGALPVQNGTLFRAWSTVARHIEVCVDGQLTPMQALENGIFEVTLPVHARARYHFVLDGQDTPDPYARFLPDGLHGDAEIIDTRQFHWQHAGWHGISLHECVFYELHVGTFTPEGTYASAVQKLPYLKELGITAVELMPLAAFPGERGWGYDGAAMFAPHASYGRPEDLQAFVDAAHALGLAVFLDVVYNHFGPDGNFLSAFSPSYFTDRFQSPWGDGLDYHEPHMRRYITDNALMWLTEYRIDGLRLDATQAMQDDSDKHILQELAEEVHSLGGHHLMLAEDYRNLPELVTDFHLDCIWVDDFHHEVRVTLTAEQDGYYGPFEGGAAALSHVLRRGWVFEGQEWPLEERPRGKPADRLDAPNFVYFIQNHDQIGNRASGDRLNHHPAVSPRAFRAASMLLLTLPMTPLLFQGQEWAASTPFLFFTDHHGELGKLVSEGRKQEFGHFEGFSGDVPDPQDAATFEASRLNWAEQNSGEHAQTLALYRDLLALRRSDAVLKDSRRDTLEAGHRGDLLWVRRSDRHGVRLLLWNLGATVHMQDVELPHPIPPRLLIHSEGHYRDEAFTHGVLGQHEAVLLAGP